MAERKKEFIKKIEEALLMDHDRNGVKSVKYLKHDNNAEYIVVIYDNDHKSWIHVTANANGANLREIAGEVYGTGSVGHFVPSPELKKVLEAKLDEEKRSIRDNA